MGNRRSSRELAMQALFDLDMSTDDPEARFERFCKNFNPEKKALPFLIKLVQGVRQHKDKIDSIIETHAKNWKISRMAGVDRNVMRIAVYEQLFCPDIPAKVSINEAIDIGKKFGTEESGAFINGILDSIHSQLKTKDGIIEAKEDFIKTTAKAEKE